jgi:hypothetical protein
MQLPTSSRKADEANFPPLCPLPRFDLHREYRNGSREVILNDEHAREDDATADRSERHTEHLMIGPIQIGSSHGERSVRPHAEALHVSLPEQSATLSG